MSQLLLWPAVTAVTIPITITVRTAITGNTELGELFLIPIDFMVATGSGLVAAPIASNFLCKTLKTSVYKLTPIAPIISCTVTAILHLGGDTN